MKKNKWMLAFVILFAMNLLLGISLSYFLFFPKTSHDQETSPYELNEVSENTNPSLEIMATKRDLMRVINHYIKDETDNNKFQYEVKLSDYFELHGSIPVFNSRIPLELYFTPLAMDSGNLLLQHKEMKVGQLSLPVPFVLKLIADNFEFPEWVTIKPDEEEIYISLEQIKFTSDVQVRANYFDLEKDEISFQLIVPTN